MSGPRSGQFCARRHSTDPGMPPSTRCPAFAISIRLRFKTSARVRPSRLRQSRSRGGPARQVLIARTATLSLHGSPQPLRPEMDSDTDVVLTAGTSAPSKVGDMVVDERLRGLLHGRRRPVHRFSIKRSDLANHGHGAPKRCREANILPRASQRNHGARIDHDTCLHRESTPDMEQPS